MALGIANNRSRVALTSFALFCFSLFLTAYSAKRPQFASFGAAVLAEVTQPLQGLVGGVYSSIGQVWSGYVALVGTHRENEILRERLKVLEAQNSGLLEFKGENQQLRRLLKMVESTGHQGVVANVIGYDPSNWVEGLTINKGTNDGVRPGMAVVDGDALVGQVMTAAPNSSLVLLLTDHGSGIDGLVQEGRARGVVEGAGGERCRWRYVSREEEVRIGDRVVTSGMDGIFPKGLLIGIVTGIDNKLSGLFQTIEVAPSVNLPKLESVYVIQDYSRPNSLGGKP